MATLKEQMAADMQNVFLNTNDFAISVTYTPTGGEAKTISMVLDFDPREMENEERGRVLLRSGRGLLAKADVAAVTIGDAVTIGGAEWNVSGIEGEDDVSWEIGIRRVERQEVGQEHYYMNRS